jgi:2-polyprenyl-6-methoxyphenol hydroxylase-like FAD-dependent oxidoreductase
MRVTDADTSRGKMPERKTTSDVEVLIVGAGPTGLVLALWLTRLGARVRIVDKTAKSGTTSRALAVQARTLELYDQTGLADEVIARGRQAVAVNLWVAGKKKARAVFGALGAGISPFPYALVFPQDEHEALLIDRLSELGVSIERETTLLDFEIVSDRVRARLKRADGAEQTCEVAYLAGCDGARSTVRETLGIGFPGGTYAHLFYVADVEASGATIDGELHVGLDKSDFLAIFPLKAEGRARLVGTVRDQARQDQDALEWSDVGKQVVAWMQVDVAKVNWFSSYRVHHRVADHFRRDNVFLLGDAAHIHSPVGGQGMNTGIGYAVNLAWKLAAVLQGRAEVTLLDSFEPERIAFARRLVATTDRAFTAVMSSSAIARRVRLDIVPVLFPLLFALRIVRRAMFRTVSQTGVNYRGSGLSEGRAGAVWGGDRLPWVSMVSKAAATDNYQPLRSQDWQIHVYGEAAPELVTMCNARELPLHIFAWRSEMDRAGLRRGAIYLLRPDGYVGLAEAFGRVSAVTSYLDRRKLKSGNGR